MAQTAQKRKRKEDVIQIRASAETKALLQQAAQIRGQKLSEFMLESARRKAEDTILDQRLFILSPEEHEKFLEMLDNPPKPNKKLIELMRRKPMWER